MADILNRTDFASRITIWFDRAYNSLQRRFNFQCMSVTEFLVTTVGMTEFPIPNDIKKSMHLYLFDPSGTGTYGAGTGGGVVKLYRETLLDEVRGALVTASCDTVFTNWHNTLIFSPPISPPEAGCELRYDYYRYLIPEDNDWFMTRAEDYLVYRGLAESAPFLAGDYRLQIWSSFAKENFDELHRAEVDQIHSGPLWLRG